MAPKSSSTCIFSFRSSSFCRSSPINPPAENRMELPGYASLRCFDEIDQVINFGDAAHLGFDAFERLRRIEARGQQQAKGLLNVANTLVGESLAAQAQSVRAVAFGLHAVGARVRRRVLDQLRE